MSRAPLAIPILESLAKCLGDTSNGMSHSDIDRAFTALHLKDCAPGQAKWKRIFNTLATNQAKKKNSGVVWEFVEYWMAPSRFIRSRSNFLRWKHDLNEILSLAGLHLSDQGKVEEGILATTLDEAALIADRVIAELHRRNIHQQVLRYCETELLQQDLFHAVHEATKGLSERLREASGETLDGNDLFDACFRDQDGLPLIVLNNYESGSEKSEHRGFANLLRGAHGMWRNPTAHNLRATTSMVEADVIEILTVLSYLHTVLDRAIAIHTDTNV